MVIQPHALAVATGIFVMTLSASGQDPETKDLAIKRQLVEKEEQERDAEHRESERRELIEAEGLDAAADAELQREPGDSLAEPGDEDVRAIDTVPVKSDDRERYEEFYRRYKGDHVFHTPRLRAQLDLTPDQADQLDELEIDWDAEVDRIRADFSKNRKRAMRDLKHARREMEDRVWNLLTAEQQELWTLLLSETNDGSEQLKQADVRNRPALQAARDHSGETYRVSELLGKTVTIQEDQQAGEIVDLVGLQGGPIEYAVATYNQQYYAVPFGALTTAAGVPGFFVDISPTAFGQLPFFTAATFPNFFSADFQQSAFDTFGVAGATFSDGTITTFDDGPIGGPAAAQQRSPTTQGDAQRNPQGRRTSPLDRAPGRPQRRGQEDRNAPNEPGDAEHNTTSPGRQPANPDETQPGKQQPFHPKPNPGAAPPKRPQPSTPTPRQPAQPVPKAGAPGAK